MTWKTKQGGEGTPLWESYLQPSPSKMMLPSYPLGRPKVTFLTKIQSPKIPKKNEYIPRLKVDLVVVLPALTTSVCLLSSK
jgi:hypothetical protein